MLRLQGIAKRYGRDEVLRDISLQVGAGRTLVLFGSSGAGKTVLLRLIAGVIDADRGDVFIDGVDVHGVEAEQRGIGMAFQNFALFPHMSAFDNIASALTSTMRDRQQIKTRVQRVAELLKIGHVLGQRPAALSNGQKQRTSLARALVAEPRLLLLDDPLRNVDAKLRFEMRMELPRLLREQGTTVVYVTQDFREAMALADTIAVIEQGMVRQIGAPEAIYTAPANLQIASLFGDPAINQLDVEPQEDEHGVYVTVSDVRFSLPAGLVSAVGQPCVLGVRAEHIDFVSAHEAPPVNAIPVTVEATTPLNEKVVNLVSTLRGRELLVSRPAHQASAVRGLVHITVNTANALLFERGSGQRIEPVSGITESLSASGAAS